ncbi:TraK family protein [Pseudomonas sp. 29]|uniref:TraK family protein n=1 Tax=Pseudomonas sp. 29 TaxID=2035197 RepID=UPI000C189491|nr:TraK family protein [Pseudomonas sp. 29]
MHNQTESFGSGSRTRRGNGLVSFVAVMNEVKSKIDQGYPLIRIYELFEDRLDLGYTQFTKYVTRHIKQGKPIF